MARLLSYGPTKVPAGINYYVGGNTKFYGAALFRLRPRTSARSPTTAGSPPRGRSTTPTWSRTTPRRSSSTRCTGATATTRRRVRPARSTPSGRSRTSPGSSSSATTWRRPGCTRSTCRSASTCTRTSRPAHPRQRLHPVQQGRRVPLPARRQERRAGIGVEPALATGNVTLVTGPTCAGWRPTPPGAPSLRSSTEVARRGRCRSPRTSWWSPAAR